MLPQVDTGKATESEAANQAIIAKLLTGQVDHHRRHLSVSGRRDVNGYCDDCRGRGNSGQRRTTTYH